MAKRKLTRKEVERRITQALIEIGSEMGLGKPEEVKKKVQSLLQNPSRYKTEAVMPPLLACFFYGLFGQRLKRGMTEDALEQFINGLRRVATQIPTRIRKEMNDMKKQLRRRGGPGRRSLLDTTQQREAIQYVTMMSGQGKTFPQAFQETAAIFQAKGIEVKPRTIKRIWQKRKVLHAQSV